MIVLDPALVEMCWRFGLAVCAAYAAGQSTALSCDDIEKDPVRQARAKEAECIAAIAKGLDPYTAVNWVTGNGPDPGWDLLWRDLRIDVKGYNYRYQYTTWPVTKNHLYLSRPFDIILSVRLYERGEGEVAGWIGKWAFYERKGIWTEEDTRQAELRLKPGPLRLGTWYMPTKDLLPLWLLEECHAA
jgi:hypothetical protein